MKTAVPKFDFDKKFQAKLVRVIFQFPEEGRDIVEHLSPAMFDTAPMRWVVGKIKSLVEKGIPATSTVLEYEAVRDAQLGIVRAGHVGAYAKFLGALKTKVPDKTFILDRAFDYIRFVDAREMTIGLAEQLKNPARIDWSSIRSQLDHHRQLGERMDGGLGQDFFSEVSARAKRRRRVELTGVPTGIGCLDSRMRTKGLPPKLLGVIVAPPGRGKCLHPDTPVLKHTGDVVPAKAIKVGDELMGPDSRPRRVLSVARGRGSMYRVTPVKGAPWVCNDVHILTLVNTDTNEIVDIPLNEYLNRSSWFKERHKLFSVGVDFPRARKALPVDPYFFGVWLGDGNKSPRCVRVSKPDKEILSVCLATARVWGLSVRVDTNNPGCPTYSLTSSRSKGKSRLNSNPLLTELRRLGYSAIPKVYLTASRRDRREILAGLLDTDGHLHYGGYDIVQKRKAIATGICFLARSLGLRAEMTRKLVPGYGYYWRVGISGDCSVLPLRIPRKQAPRRKQIKDATRTGFTVQSLPRGGYAGFTLDGDGRFLLGDFTVTHNTAMLVFISRSGVLYGQRVVYISLELDEDMIAERLDASFSAIKIQQLVHRSLRLKAKLKEIHKSCGGELRVKFFPPGMLTLAGLRSYLRRLEAAAFYPSMVIIDYADNMDLKEFGGGTDEKDYGPLGRLYIGLRGLAGELNIPIWTASQSNREALAGKSGRIGLQHLADSFRKAAVADFIVGISQTTGDKANKYAKLVIMKNRLGPTEDKDYPVRFDTARVMIDDK